MVMRSVGTSICGAVSGGAAASALPAPALSEPRNQYEPILGCEENWLLLLCCQTSKEQKNDTTVVLGG